MENENDLRAEAAKALDSVMAVDVALSSHVDEVSGASPLSPDQIRELRDTLAEAIGALKLLLVALK